LGIKYLLQSNWLTGRKYQLTDFYWKHFKFLAKVAAATLGWRGIVVKRRFLEGKNSII
jgi:hypothetical protein